MNKTIKKRKRIFILRSNPVNPDSRVEKEAAALAVAGYDVHIIAWDRDSEINEVYDYVDVDGIKIPIVRFGHKASFGDGLKNIRPFLFFQWHLYSYLKANPCDVIHACDYDTAYTARKAYNRKKSKFIYDIFDFDRGRQDHFLSKIMRHIQKNIVLKSDATIICTEERINQFNGYRPHKYAVIHNSPHLKPTTEDSHNESDRIRLAYVGILIDNRLLKEISEFVVENPKYELHIGGFGMLENYFATLSNKYDNIIFYGKIPYKRTLEIEESCDILLAVYDPTVINHKYAAPNKFYEGLMLGKPLIMAKGTGMSNVLLENDIGVVVDFTKEGFESGVHELTTRKDEWTQMSKKMKEIYDRDYSWDVMSKRLINLYEDIF